jgi:dephospho-CoA kinase
MSATHQQQQTDRLIIGIAGRIGAGKTSAAKYLSTRYGFQYLRYSLVLKDWRASDSNSKHELQEIGWQVMAGGMQEELNRRLIAQIGPDTSVAVDGLRHPIDYEAQKRSFLSLFHLLYIDSPRNIRWTRLRGRGRYESQEAFDTADSHPVEQQIESLKNKAEAVLHNEGSLEEMYLSLERSISSFRSEGHV